MTAPPTIVDADEARARIAELTNGAESASHVGSIELKPHQRHAIVRIEAALREFGGALLADETGLGKTYVALGVARAARRPIVVAPAALRDMWQRAATVADVHLPFVSMEALSHARCAASGGRPGDDPDLVIVDEAHHFRNPATARYRALAALTSTARVLLLSATPVHNRARDLVALLALFLGERASVLDAAWMARCIIRRGAGDAPLEHIPRVEAPRMLSIDHQERHLDAILALPPPVPPIDGGDGGTLIVYSLLRQWASSQGALAEALRRRLARATALLAGMDVGRYPSKGELAAWAFTDGSLQLAFPELVVADEHAAAPERGLESCVRMHMAAVRALLDDLVRGADPDAERAAHLAALMARPDSGKIVAFSQYADTVSALFRLLRRKPGVAALTADGGRIAGGTLTRGETLARFAPIAHGVPSPGRAQRIDLLLTTDLLSEGVNLQDAGVVVHLDLPWTPARLEQRVGRVARLGSARASIGVHVMLPPASAERIVRVEQRLRDKLRATTRAIGVIGTILPSLAMPGAINDAADGPGSTLGVAHAPSEVAEAIRTIISRWRSRARKVAPRPANGLASVASAIRAPMRGFLALVGDTAQPRLVADVGSGPTDDPAVVLAAVRVVDDAVAPVAPIAARDLAEAISAIARWRSRTAIRRDLSVDGALRARSRRSVVDRISAITRRAPRHLRPAITALAVSARRTVTSRYGAGAERVLGELAEAAMPDEAWLRAVSTFGALHGATADASNPQFSLLTLILLRDIADGADET